MSIKSFKEFLNENEAEFSSDDSPSYQRKSIIKAMRNCADSNDWDSLLDIVDRISPDDYDSDSISDEDGDTAIDDVSDKLDSMESDEVKDIYRSLKHNDLLKKDKEEEDGDEEKSDS